jgi:hypothetical protein
LKNERKEMNKTTIIVGILGAFTLGVLSGYLGQQYLMPVDRYTIQVVNAGVALKIDKRTGESWRFDPHNNIWLPVRNGFIGPDKDISN